jgi:hypothetical protein
MWSRKDLRDMAPIQEPGNSSGTERVAPASVSAEGEKPTMSAGTGFQLRAGPILVVIILSIALPVTASLILDVIGGYIPVAALHNQPLVSRFIDHAIELAIALGIIRYLKRSIPGDFGLRFPPGRSYVATAILAGIGFGVLMGLLNNSVQLLSHLPLLPNVMGSSLFQDVFVGPMDEIPYRALLVTYLTAKMPGRVRWRRFEMNGAGIVVAVILAFGFANSLLGGMILPALGQFAGGVLLGVSYAYWFEKSRSVLAPIVGHAVTGLTELAMVYALSTLLT